MFERELRLTTAKPEGARQSSYFTLSTEHNNDSEQAEAQNLVTGESLPAPCLVKRRHSE